MIIGDNDRHNLFSMIAERSDVIEKKVIRRLLNQRTWRRSRNFYETFLVWQEERQARR